VSTQDDFGYNIRNFLINRQLQTTTTTTTNAFITPKPGSAVRTHYIKLRQHMNRKRDSNSGIQTARPTNRMRPGNAAPASRIVPTTAHDADIKHHSAVINTNRKMLLLKQRLLLYGMLPPEKKQLLKRKLRLGIKTVAKA
jgi:hypothetical protein